MPAVEDGQFDIVGITLLVGLLAQIGHDSHLVRRRCQSGGSIIDIIIANHSSKVHKTAVKKCLLPCRICYTEYKSDANSRVFGCLPKMVRLFLCMTTTCLPEGSTQQERRVELWQIPLN
ncbi:hypothetical protein SUBVAR_05551 [Subdoligranulum variabile DSM 15176]|uniref:Uncharacterized protein n=1 Tax=Subdoligranulum variabile DSM 15176 TaxID=411471 RepID=D1PMJ0_9FIRM|nr:hypothetical protein SUBVAR_05551 [Subdoligranulum variabile DSM 15176]